MPAVIWGVVVIFYISNFIWVNIWKLDSYRWMDGPCRRNTYHLWQYNFIMGPREFRKGKLGKGYDLSVFLTSHWAMFVHCQFVDIIVLHPLTPENLRKNILEVATTIPLKKNIKNPKSKRTTLLLGEGFVRVTSSTSIFCCTGFLPQSNEHKHRCFEAAVGC